MGLLEDGKGNGDLLRRMYGDIDWSDPHFNNIWESQPANDPIHPWVGLLGQQRDAINAGPPPEMPPEAEQGYEDRFAYSHRLPGPWADERAYNPTLRYEDSVAGLHEASALRRRRRANHENEPFQQPKTAGEVGLPPMTPMEKLRLLLNQYLGGNF